MHHLANSHRTSVSLRKADSGNWHILKFYFDFRQGDRIANSKHGLIDALLVQLIEQFASAVPIITETVCDGFAPLRFMKRFPDRRREMLKTLLRSIQANLFLLVDGLDECLEDIPSIINLLAESTSRHQLSSTAFLTKVCVASRPDSRISHLMQIYPVLLMQERNSPGIQRFLDDMIGHASMKSHEAEEIRRILTTIPDRAQGSFIWTRSAALLCTEAFRKGKKIADLEREFKGLPQDMELIYQQLLNRLDKVQLHMTKMYLRLIATSPRLIAALFDRALHGGWTLSWGALLTMDMLSVAMQACQGQCNVQRKLVDSVELFRMKREVAHLLACFVRIETIKDSEGEAVEVSTDDIAGRFSEPKRQAQHETCGNCETEPCYRFDVLRETRVVLQVDRL